MKNSESTAAQGEAMPPKREIESGPHPNRGYNNTAYEDVRYSIRSPEGSFEVIQRVTNDADGYKEAYARIERIVGVPAPSVASPTVEETLTFQRAYNHDRRGSGIGSSR